MNKIYLGIDTSNYRTSIAAVDEHGKVLKQKAVLLEVPEGKRGLRQSEAFFHHSNRLPGYADELFSAADPRSVVAIGVSERPRRIEGSYMPCFMAGVNCAHTLAASLKIPVYGFSHQEGHAAAVLEHEGRLPEANTLFFHLSGGTTEALLCSPDDAGYRMEIVGGTKDISVGQLIDRFGVASGLPFPSGPYLDELACSYLEKTDPAACADTFPGIMPVIRHTDGWFNLSGAETRLMRYARAHGPETDPSAAAELFSVVAGLLKEVAGYLSEKYDISAVYMAGGVASSRAVRALMDADRSFTINFGRPDLSGDNAVGTALLAKRIHETGKRFSGK